MSDSSPSHSEPPTLWLALRFPQVALDVLNKRNQQQPLVIIEGHRVFQACEQAQSLGIQPGMSVQTALLLSQASDDKSKTTLTGSEQSLSPTGSQLLMRERRQSQEQNHMQQLAQWAYQFTPYVSHWQQQDSLLLELGSCLALFGGLTQLLDSIEQQLSNKQLQVQFSLAHTPRAAWLLSWQPELIDWQVQWRSSHANVNIFDEPSFKKNIIESLNRMLLSQLPEQAPFTPKRLQQWQNIGLNNFAQLLNLPRASVAKRYGKSCLQQFDQIVGKDIDLQTYIKPSTDFFAERHYLNGLESVDMLELPVQELLIEFQQFLRHQQLQTEGFSWRFFHFDKHDSQLDIELSSAHSQADIFIQLTNLQLHQHRIDSSIETVVLRSDKLVKAKMQSQVLFSDCGQQSDADAHKLIDTLTARMGKNRLYRLQSLNDHLPESRQGVSHDIQDSHCASNIADQQLPLWLLPNPIPLRQPQQQAMTLLSSAYRIDSHWWQQRQQRDYFIAHDRQGHHWIYFDHGQKRWFLHGHYG
ncbi:MAG: Y-family DNA polymerase [Cellvibrionaceae bacterium]